MNVLIAGYGNIGRYIEKELTHKDIHIYKYDKLYPYINYEYIDFCFICVPTDYVDNDLDISNIIDVIDKFKDIVDVFVIKSTLPINTMKKLNELYHHNFVYSPEYYGTTVQSNKIPDFLVLSGDDINTKKVSELYHKVKDGDFKIVYTSYEIAEVAKFMENTFLATKVTFCAEFNKVCETLNIDYNKLREIFVLDKRMGNSHTYIDSKQPYWDSHCLNKDVPAFINECNNLNIDLPMLQTMYKSNQERKQDYENNINR